MTSPLRTITRAVEVSRAFAPHTADSTYTIALRGGIYRLTSPISLQPIDSGLTIAAFNGELVRSVGGYVCV